MFLFRLQLRRGGKRWLLCRIQKRVGTAKTTKYLWDGNVILHEQTNNEPIVTWIFEEGTFKPTGKIVGEENYQIVCDYMGTPTDAYDANGKHTWSCELNSYGKVRNEWGTKNLVPFRYQGQYEDTETGLYYNRFRYYSTDTGLYLSQDPLRTGGGLNLYSYVTNPNISLDILGLIEAGDTIYGITNRNKTTLNVERNIEVQGVYEGSNSGHYIIIGRGQAPRIDEASRVLNTNNSTYDVNGTDVWTGFDPNKSRDANIAADQEWMRHAVEDLGYGVIDLGNDPTWKNNDTGPYYGAELELLKDLEERKLLKEKCPPK